MFRHNFLLAYRNFKRYKGSFLINLTGLSTGLACVLLIYIWVNHELSVDKFHQNDHRLCQVLEHIQGNESIQTRVETSGPMAEALVEEMAGVEYAAAVAPTSFPGFDSFTLSVGEKNTKATGQYVGKDYFNIFSFELIHGNKNQVLADKNSIVLTEELAMKLFDTTEDIIGKVVEFQHERQFLVSGVLKQIPDNSSIQFDFALSFKIFEEIKPWALSWGSSGPRVYALLNEGTDIQQVNQGLTDFANRRQPETIRSPFLKRFSENYLFGNYENGVQAGGRIEYVRLFSAVALIILLIACINFMNLSTARASRRLKEIGIKKVVGSRRKGFIFQYLGESVLISFFSLIIAIFLVAISLPQFNEITGRQFTLGFDSRLILSALAITLFTGIIAGFYPALYLSAFKPINILKGDLKASTGGLWARKGLVVFQFTLSIILMVSVWVVHSQINFVQRQHLGYDKENVVHFEIAGRIKETPETFLSEMKRIPGILNASSSAHRIVGKNWSGTGLEWEGKDPDDVTLFEFVTVNYDLLETLGIEVIEGRSFSRDFGADTKKVIFNETAIKVMGLKEPIGNTVEFFGKREIIGVVRDFHFESFHKELRPTCFLMTPGSENKIMAKLEAGREKETLARLQSFYETYNPGFVFDYRFLDDDYQALYAAEQRVSTLSKYFTGIAILISCLGLFGLAAFTAERRLKEIGIRKILGSSTFGIVRLLSVDFTKMVCIAIGIALPLSHFITAKWLESFAYRIDLKWWFFIGAGLMALLIAWFTVGLQTIKAARVNPTECLKDE